jgi:tight adherence protein B
MGMTFTEYSLFIGGAACLSCFLLRTLAPFLRSRLDNTSESASRILREEFLSFAPGQVRVILLSAGGVAALSAMLSTGEIFWIFVAGGCPVLLCGVLARYIRSKRRKRIVSQLPAFLEILSGHVKAGHSIPESLQASITLLPSGIQEEIRWLCQTIRLGTPLPDALRMWEERMASEEISMIVCPLRIAIPAGGNVYDLLTRSRDILNAKIRQQNKMRSLTAQARLQALVLTLLPPGFIAVLSRIDPEYLSRCRDSGAGRTILGIAGALQLLGWICIRRIMAANK